MWRVYDYLHMFNWHKHWPLQQIMCWFQRHDYGVHEVTGANSVILMCYYCEHKKHEHINRG